MLDINKINKRFALRIIVPIIGVLSVLCFGASQVSAATTDPPTGGGGSPTPSSTVRCEDGNEQGDCAKTTAFAFAGCGNDNVGIRCLVVEVLKFLSVGVGLAVVGGVATGGIVYATAGGNPSKVQSGIKIIVNSVIALVMYLLMFAILQFLIPGGVITAS